MNCDARSRTRLSAIAGVTILLITLIYGAIPAALQASSPAPSDYQADTPSNPQNIEVAGELVDISVGDIAIAGKYIYMPIRFQRLSSCECFRDMRIIDISQSDGPVEVGLYTILDEGAITKIEADSNYLYVSVIIFLTLNLVIFDISDPVHPQELGSVEVGKYIPAYTEQYIHSIEIRGEYAYLSGGVSSKLGGSHGNLLIFDISNRSAPLKLSGLSLPDQLHDMEIIGQHAVIASSTGGVYIINIQDPSKPVEVAKHSTLSPIALAARGTYTYLVDANETSRSLQVVDLSDLSSPKVASNTFWTDKQDWPTDAQIIVQGLYVYIISDGDLRLFDVSQVTKPVQVGFYELTKYDTSDEPRPNSRMEVSGNTIYAGYSNHTWLRALRFSSPQISGSVRDFNGVPVAGVTISAGAGQNATTDGSGAYSFPDLLAGTYTLTPTLNGYTFAPPTSTLQLGGESLWQAFIRVPLPVAAIVSAGTSATLSYTDTQGLRTNLLIPSAAVTSTLALTLTPTIAAGGPGWTTAGHAFDLAASQDGGVLLTFAAPLTATIRYSAADLRLVADESQLELRWWDGEEWQDVEATCGPVALNTAANSLRAPLCRAGRYALFGPTNSVYLPLA
jgi:hypothetical protein